MPLIDGRALAQQWFVHLKERVRKLGPSLQPSLSVLQLGKNAESTTYVQMKEKACRSLGISFEKHLFHLSQKDLPLNEESDDKMMKKMAEKIDILNAKKNCHGIIVQLPLPDPTYHTLLNRIDPKKDVDGLHSWNVGELGRQYGAPYFVPGTAKAILQLLQWNLLGAPSSAITDWMPKLHEKKQKEKGLFYGKRVVILGRSNLVGRPLFQVLMREDATITLCHSRTDQVHKYIEEADIVIVAIGKPEKIPIEWFTKPHVIVIDVGIHRVLGSGSRSFLVGDVNQRILPENVWITPVPGGVGPMTVMMLMENIIESAERQLSTS